MTDKDYQDDIDLCMATDSMDFYKELQRGVKGTLDYPGLIKMAMQYLDLLHKHSFLTPKGTKATRVATFRSFLLFARVNNVTYLQLRRAPVTKQALDDVQTILCDYNISLSVTGTLRRADLKDVTRLDISVEENEDSMTLESFILEAYNRIQQ